jgi:hypothetical protein
MSEVVNNEISFLYGFKAYSNQFFLIPGAATPSRTKKPRDPPFSGRAKPVIYITCHLQQRAKPGANPHTNTLT